MKCRVAPARGRVLPTVEVTPELVVEEEIEEVEDGGSEEGEGGVLSPNGGGEEETSAEENNAYTYKCKCGKQFRRLATLQRHAQTMHAANEAFKCAECTRTFTTSRKLTIHRLSAHAKGTETIGAGLEFPASGKPRPGRPRINLLTKNPVVAVAEAVRPTERPVETVGLNLVEVVKTGGASDQKLLSGSGFQNVISTSRAARANDVTNAFRSSSSAGVVVAAPQIPTTSAPSANTLVLQKIIQLPNGVPIKHGNDANDNTVIFFDQNRGSFMRAYAIPLPKVCPRNSTADGQQQSTASVLNQDCFADLTNCDEETQVAEDIETLHAQLDIKQLEMLDSEAIARATKAAVAKHAVSSFSLPGAISTTTLVRPAAVTNNTTTPSSLAASLSITPGCGLELTSRNLSTVTAAVACRSPAVGVASSGGYNGNDRFSGVPRLVPSFSSSSFASHQTMATPLKRSSDGQDNAMSRNGRASIPFTRVYSGANVVVAAARAESNNNNNSSIAGTMVNVSLLASARPQHHQPIAPKCIVYTPPATGGGGAVRGVVTVVNRGGVQQRSSAPILVAVPSSGMIQQSSVYNGSQVVYSNAGINSNQSFGGGQQVKQQPLRIVPVSGSNFAPVMAQRKEVAPQNRTVTSVAVSNVSEVGNITRLNQLDAQTLALMQRSNVRMRTSDDAHDDGGAPQSKQARFDGGDEGINSRATSLYVSNPSGNGGMRGGQDGGAVGAYNTDASKAILANVENQLSPHLIIPAGAVNSLKICLCTTCGKEFVSEKYLSMHMSLHKDPYYNDSLMLEASGSNSNGGTGDTGGGGGLLVSGNGFMSGGVELSNGESPIRRSAKGAVAQWTCKICEKTFAQNSNYKNHLRTHTNDRPFVCNICCIGFKERYHLKKHKLFKHSTEQKEECRVCGKRFKDSTAVRAHERTHSDLRPYACPRCDKTFKTSECLWHHENRSKTCGKSLGDLPASLGGGDKPAQRTRRSRLPRQPRIPLDPSQVSLAIQQLQRFEQARQHLQQQQQEQELLQQIQQQQQEEELQQLQLQQQRREEKFQQQQQLHQQQLDLQIHQQIEESECLTDLDLHDLYNNDSGLPQIPIYSHCEVVTESSSQVLSTDPPTRVLLGPIQTGYPELRNAFIRSEQDPTMPVVKVETEIDLDDYHLTGMSPLQSCLEECYPDDFGLNLDEEDEEEDEEDSSSLGGTTELNSDTTDSDVGITTDPVVQFSDMGAGASSWGYPASTSVTVESEEMVAVGSRRDCGQCGKRFSTLSALEKHAIVHNEDRPFRCELCNSGFKLKVHLKKHMLYRHSDEYPCECSICGKRFKDSSAVRLHERIHSTDRPFQCACGKSFKTRENLWGHRHRGPCERSSAGDDFLLANLRLFQSDSGPIWGFPLNAATAAAASAGVGMGGANAVGGGIQSDNNIFMNSLSSSSAITSGMDSFTSSASTVTEADLHELFFSNTIMNAVASMQHEPPAGSRAIALSSHYPTSTEGNTAFSNSSPTGRTTLTSSSHSWAAAKPAVVTASQQQLQDTASSRGLTTPLSSATAAMMDPSVNDLTRDQLIAYISSIIYNGYPKSSSDATTLQSLSSLFESHSNTLSSNAARSSAVGGPSVGTQVVSCSTSTASSGAYLPTAVVVPIKRVKKALSPSPPTTTTGTTQDGASVTSPEQLYSLPPFETLIPAHSSPSAHRQSKNEMTSSVSSSGGSSTSADKCSTVQSRGSSEMVRLPGIQQLLLTHSMSSPHPTTNSRSSTPGSVRIGSPAVCGDGIGLKQQTFVGQDAIIGQPSGRSPSYTSYVSLPPPPPYPGGNMVGGECKGSPSSMDNEYVRRTPGSPASASMGGLSTWASDLSFGDLPVTSSY